MAVADRRGTAECRRSISFGHFLRDTLPAWAVFAVSLFGTGLAWYLTDSAVQRETLSRFEGEIAAVETDLIERLQAYEQVLPGGVSLFHSWPAVTRENWRRYVEHLRIAENYPGIQGIGFAKLIPPDDRHSHVLEVRAEGFPGYQIWPEGDRETYTTIVYLEPFDWRNQRAFGYDMFQHPVRRIAMERARDTGATSLSGKVTLVQETEDGVQAGFLMYLPVYASPSPESVSDRRSQLIGYVYSPFRMANFMKGLLGGRRPNVGLQIFDGQTMTDDALMYSSASLEEHVTVPNPLVATVPLELNGQTWTLRFSALPWLRADRSKATIVALGGLLISCLLWAIVWSLAKNRSQAAPRTSACSRTSKGANGPKRSSVKRKQASAISSSRTPTRCGCSTARRLPYSRSTMQPHCISGIRATNCGTCESLNCVPPKTSNN